MARAPARSPVSTGSTAYSVNSRLWRPDSSRDVGSFSSPKPVRMIRLTSGGYARSLGATGDMRAKHMTSYLQMRVVLI